MNILKSLISVSLITLISRLLGFIRDVLIAHIFGASFFTDVFFVAFKIPNLLRRIFAEGIFSQSFIPVLVEYKNKKNQVYIQNFISSTSGAIILFLCILIILGIFFAHYLIIISAPGFSHLPEKLKLSVRLLTIMFPYILLISMSSLSASILNIWNYFVIPSLSPIFLNLSIIFFVVFFNSFFHLPVFCLAWGVVLGGVFQFFYQFPCLYKINMLVVPNINFKNTGLIRVLKKMGPAILGVFVSQISLIINTAFSSLLSQGSISWIYYADRLIELPVGILSASLSAILFTSLSKAYKKKNYSEYKKLFNWGLRISLILSVPSSVFLFILSKPLVSILFKHGNFINFDVLMTSKVLELYSFGLISFILVKILVFVFYSFEEIKIPVKISILTIFLTQMINPVLIFYFQHAGLALSTSITSWINLLLLYLKLRHKKIIQFDQKWLMFIFQLFLSTLIMIFILICLLYITPSWKIGSFFNQMIRLFFILIFSGISYFSVLHFLGMKLLNLSYFLEKK